MQKEEAIQIFDQYIEIARASKNVCLSDVAVLTGSDPKSFDYKGLLDLISKGALSDEKKIRSYVGATYKGLTPDVKNKLCLKLSQTVELVESVYELSSLDVEKMTPDRFEAMMGGISDYLAKFDEVYHGALQEEFFKTSKEIESLIQGSFEKGRAGYQEEMMKAIANGDLKEVRKLLGADTLASFEDKTGQSPLFLALRNKNYEIVQALVQEGGVSLSGETGEKAFEILLEGRHKKNRYNIDRLHILLDLGMDAAVSVKGMTPLKHVLKYGTVKDLEKVLAKRPIISETGEEFFSLLEELKQQEDVDLKRIERLDTFLKTKVFASSRSDSQKEPKKEEEDLFVEAIEKGNLDGAKKYLKKRDVNTFVQDSISPLNAAVHFGQKEMVNFLIEKGAQVDALDKTGRTALMTAALKGNKEIVSLLLEKGADVHTKDQYGRDVIERLDLQIGRANQKTADQLSEVKELIKEKLTKIDERDPEMKTKLNDQLKTVVAAGKVAELHSLIKKGADVNFQDSKGNTPLFYAIMNGSKEGVRALLEVGADLNIKNNAGQTPLEAAESILVAHGSLKDKYYAEKLDLYYDMKGVVDRFLAEKDRKPMSEELPHEEENEDTVILEDVINEGEEEKEDTVILEDNENEEPVDEAEEEKAEEEGAPVTDEKTNEGHSEASLFAAAAFAHNDEKVKTLQSEGKNINALDNQDEVALFKVLDDEEAVIVLLNNGANVNVKNADGDTALIRGVQTGASESVIKTLIDAGADANEKNLSGDSAFGAAAANGRLDVMHLLMGVDGIDLDVKDNEGNSAYQLAAQNGQVAVLKELEKAGLSDKDVNAFGQTVLMQALMNRQYGVAQYLMNEKKADLTLVDNHGRTMMDYYEMGLKTADNPMEAQNQSAGLYVNLLKKKIKTREESILSGKDPMKKIELGVEKLGAIQGAHVKTLLSRDGFENVKKEDIFEALKKNQLASDEQIDAFMQKQAPTLQKGSVAYDNAVSNLKAISSTQKGIEAGNDLLKTPQVKEKQKRNEALTPEEERLLSPERQKELEDYKKEFANGQDAISEAYKKHVEPETTFDKINQQRKDAMGILKGYNDDVIQAGPNDFKENIEKFDWDKLFDEGLWSKLNNIPGDSCADLAMNLFLTVFISAPAELLGKYYKQQQELEKKNKEIQRRNREEYVANELKDQNLTQSAVAKGVASRGLKYILTKDPCLQGLDLNDPAVVKKLTSRQQDAYKRYTFAQSLPRVEGSDNIDWSKLTSKQQKQYAKYMKEYVYSPDCRYYVGNCYRLAPNDDELNIILERALGIHVQLESEKELSNDPTTTPEAQKENEYLMPREATRHMAHKVMDFIENPPKNTKLAQEVASFPRDTNGKLDYERFDDHQQGVYKTYATGYLCSEPMKKELAKVLGREVTQDDLHRMVHAATSYIFGSGLKEELFEKDKQFNQANKLINEGKTDDLRSMIESGLDVNHQMPDGTSLLMLASVGGNKKAVELLVNAGADVKAKNFEGQTAQDLANIVYGETKEPKYQEIISLIQNEPQVEIKEAPVEKQAAEERPIEERKVEVKPAPLAIKPEVQKRLDNALLGLSPVTKYEEIQSLIDQGADINATDQQGNTPLLKLLFSPSASKDKLDLLLKNGADVNAKNKDGLTPLMQATYIGDLAVMSALVQNGADVNKSGYASKETLLHMAVRLKNPDALAFLINNGAKSNIDAKGVKGRTALMEAILSGNKEVIAELVKGGADWSAKDANGETALEYLLKTKNLKLAAEIINTIDRASFEKALAESGVQNALMLQQLKENFRALQQPTRGPGVVGKTQPFSRSNLQMEKEFRKAAQEGNATKVENLIKQGVDVNAVSSGLGQTALMQAVLNGHDKVVSILINNKADVNKTDTNGNSPLIYALSRPTLESRLVQSMVSNLLSAGANPYHQSRKGVSVADKLKTHPSKELKNLFAAMTGDNSFKPDDEGRTGDYDEGKENGEKQVVTPEKPMVKGDEQKLENVLAGEEKGKKTLVSGEKVQEEEVEIQKQEEVQRTYEPPRMTGVRSQLEPEEVQSTGPSEEELARQTAERMRQEALRNQLNQAIRAGDAEKAKELVEDEVIDVTAEEIDQKVQSGYDDEAIVSEEQEMGSSEAEVEAEEVLAQEEQEMESAEAEVEAEEVLAQEEQEMESAEAEVEAEEVLAQEEQEMESAEAEVEAEEVLAKEEQEMESAEAEVEAEEVLAPKEQEMESAEAEVEAEEVLAPKGQEMESAEAEVEAEEVLAPKEQEMESIEAEEQPLEKSLEQVDFPEPKPLEQEAEQELPEPKGLFVEQTTEQELAMPEPVAHPNWMDEEMVMKDPLTGEEISLDPSGLFVAPDQELQSTPAQPEVVSPVVETVIVEQAQPQPQPPFVEKTDRSKGKQEPKNAKAPQVDEQGRLIIDKYQSGKAEKDLMFDVLDGKQLSDKQMDQLGNIMSEMGIEGNRDALSTGDKGTVGRLVDAFNQERLTESNVPEQRVSDEVREAVAELYVYGSLDDFTLTDKKAGKLAGLKNKADKSGTKEDKKEFLKEGVRAVAEARARRKKLVELEQRKMEVRKKQAEVNRIRNNLRDKEEANRARQTLQSQYSNQGQNQGY